MLTFTGLGIAPTLHFPATAATSSVPPTTPVAASTHLSILNRANMLHAMAAGAPAPTLPPPPMLPQTPLLPPTPGTSTTSQSGGSTGMQANVVCGDGSVVSDPTMCPTLAPDPNVAAAASGTDDGSNPSPGMQVSASVDPTVPTVTATVMPTPSVFSSVLPSDGSFPWLMVAAGVAAGAALFLTFRR